LEIRIYLTSMLKRTIVLSLGGSIIIPDKINVAYLNKFKSLILSFVRKGYRFVIVTGGGDICRHYQHAARQTGRISHDDLDWIGIAATKLNATLVRSMFGSAAYEDIINDPRKKVRTNKKVLVGSGWVPGFSSDKDAVMLAQVYGADSVINLSNIKYVYSADPNKVKTARPLKHISWDELLRLTGTQWKPGAHVPFDPEASKLAKKNGLRVIVCLGTNLQNLKAIIANKNFIGTKIK